MGDPPNSNPWVIDYLGFADNAMDLIGTGRPEDLVRYRSFDDGLESLCKLELLDDVLRTRPRRLDRNGVKQQEKLSASATGKR
jgi:hypothetical protein